MVAVVLSMAEHLGIQPPPSRPTYERSTRDIDVDTEDLSNTDFMRVSLFERHFYFSILHIFYILRYFGLVFAQLARGVPC